MGIVVCRKKGNCPESAMHICPTQGWMMKFNMTDNEIINYGIKPLCCQPWAVELWLRNKSVIKVSPFPVLSLQLQMLSAHVPGWETERVSKNTQILNRQHCFWFLTVGWAIHRSVYILPFVWTTTNRARLGSKDKERTIIMCMWPRHFQAFFYYFYSKDIAVIVSIYSIYSEFENLFDVIIDHVGVLAGCWRETGAHGGWTQNPSAGSQHHYHVTILPTWL